MSGIKNAAQIQFSEYFEDFRQLGFNQAQMARALEMARASITRILKGEQTPRPHTLKNARETLARLKAAKYPEAAPEVVVGTDSNEVKSAAMELREIHEADPEGFQTIRKVIGTYHRNRPVPEAIVKKASGWHSFAAEASEKSRPVPKSGTARRAGKTIGGKAAPGRGTQPTTSSHTEDAGKAPK